MRIRRCRKRIEDTKKYCNDNSYIKVEIWPDENNTFLAYSYKNGIPTVEEDCLKTISEPYYNRAEALFNGVTDKTAFDAKSRPVKKETDK